MTVAQADRSVLLTTADPDPVGTINFDSPAPVILVCEHAGRAIPGRLGDLGISADVLNSHRGWDIGAEAVARDVASQLDAPLILQRYSRLVIDANRPPNSPFAIPTVSDNADIPGNRDLSEDDRQLRITSIFEPMNRRIDELFAASPRKAAFSIHSFTPELGGVERPWHAGFLSRKSIASSEALMNSVARGAPGMLMALNQPYRIEDDTDWFIPHHAETRNLPHCLIEIRNDQIQTPEGVAFWAGLLSNAITDLLETLP